MTEDTNKSKVTRRGLLSGVLAAGGAGVLGGVGTGAFLHDRETFASNFLQAGQLDLAVAWEPLAGSGTSGTSDGTAPLDIGPLEPGASGVTKITVDLPQSGKVNNPAYIWFRNRCPEPADALAAEVTVGLFYATHDGTRASDEPIVEGQLCDVAETLRNGVPLDANDNPSVSPGDQGCLDTTSDGPIRLRFEWELDDNYEGKDGESTAVTFDFAARQCRHQDGTVNPFPEVAECDCKRAFGISYVDVYTCTEQGPEFLGRLELMDSYCKEDGISENYIDPGRYSLYEDGDDCVDTEYSLNVTDTRTKTENGVTETTALAFELIGPDSYVDLCKVVICAAGVTVTYDADDLSPRSYSTEGLLEAALEKDSPIVTGSCGPPPTSGGDGGSGGGNNSSSDTTTTTDSTTTTTDSGNGGSGGGRGGGGS